MAEFVTKFAEWRCCPVCDEDVSELFPPDGEHYTNDCVHCLDGDGNADGECELYEIDGPYWYEHSDRHDCPGCGAQIYLSVDRESYASIREEL